jgi:urease accessory protein
MQHFRLPLLAFTAGSALILGSHPALAHGTAAGGALSGLSHPLLGVDHLLVLMAVGTAASLISSQLLLWALAGAVLGSVIGISGISVSGAEALAAVAIAGVGALTLLASRLARSTSPNVLTSLSGAVVAAAIAIHALLHGLEAPQDSSSMIWWGGALLSSTLVCGGTYWVMRRQPIRWSQTAAAAFMALGCGLAVAPLG